MTIHPDSLLDAAESEIRQLRELALLDELTGLPNRRAFLERMEEVVLEARGGGPAFSLVLLDLDGLKDVNDTFGYQAGNRALVEFAGALIDAVRAEDFVARIGGDEFAVLAVHAPAAEAREPFERLRALARGVQRRVKDGAPAVILSAATGRGVWGVSCRSVDDVFAAAEAGMAVAKATPPETIEAPDAFRPRGRRALGEELRSLLGMARQVTTSTGVDQLLRRVTRQAATLIGAEVATIALVQDGGIVRIDEVWREGEWRPFRSERPLGEGVLGRTAASGEPELHNSLSPSVTYDHAGVAALGLRTIVCVPLRDRHDATFGVLALGNKRGVQDFLDGDVGLAQAFADLAASAIENVRSFAATEEARAYQRALMEQARDAIFVVDPTDGRVLDTNAAMEQLSGYHRIDLLRLTVRDLGLSDEVVWRLLRDRGWQDDSPATVADSIRRKHGPRVPVELSASHVQTERGPHLLVIVRDIEERLAAEAERRQRAAELEARNEVAALLTESRSVTEALDRVLPIVISAGEMDWALVLLADETETLRLAAGAGLPPALEGVLRRLGERLTGGVTADRRPLVVNDMATDDQTVWPETRAAGIGSFAILPLVANDRALGMLGGGSVAAGVFDEARVARLRALADQIAVWLEGRHSLEEARLREQDARFLADLGESLNESRSEEEILRRLVEGVAGKLGGAALVFLRNAATDRWQLATASFADPTRLAALKRTIVAVSSDGDGVPHALIADRSRPRLYNFARGDRPDAPLLATFLEGTDAHTLIVVPMVAGEEMFGLFVAGNRGEQPVLGERQLALAQQAVQHATVAVANARAYRESRDRQTFLRAMMEQAGEAILVLDAERCRVIDANAAAERLTGRDRAELLSLEAFELVAQRDGRRLRRLVRALAAAGGDAVRWEARVRRADGRPLTAQVNASAVASEDSPAVMLLLRDITAERAAQRQRERLLRKFEEEAERSRQLLALADQLTQAGDPDTVIGIAVEACRRLAPVGRAGILRWDDEREVFVNGRSTGLNEEERLAFGDLTIAPQQPLHATVRQAEGPVVIRDARVDPRVSPEMERQFGIRALVMIPLRVGGELLGLLAADRSARERPFSRREIALLTGIAQQTATALAAATGRRRTEEARDYLEALMRDAGDGIAVTDAETRLLVDVNDRFCALLGIERANLIGTPALAHVAPEQLAEVERDFPTVGQDGMSRSVNRTLLAHDGERVPVEVINTRVTVGGRELVVGMVRDLRGRIEAERRLRFQAQVLANMRDAVVALDRAGRVVVWNRGAEELFGWSAAEMQGTIARDSVTAGGLPFLDALVQRLVREPVASGEVPFARKDGSRMRCQVTLTRMQDEAGTAIGLIGIIRNPTAEHAGTAGATALHLGEGR